MKRLSYDIVIIGAGAAGLSAAAVTAKECSTLVVDRESRTGGILRQCIHNGFGLRFFHRELTGPEYAERIAQLAQDAGADFALETTVTKIIKLGNGSFELEMMSAKDGVTTVRAKEVLLAMGCRERNRGNICTPGSRPAGVFTAGSAQKLLNIEGKLPGKSAVIVGSGDIGLIMARRLRWSGIEVKAVVEIMPYPAGLTRNIVQCLNDFNIPLYLSHSVVQIHGRDRVSGVDVAPLEKGQPVMDKAFHIDCDTVLFSVGLIPETELATDLGAKLNPATNGAWVDANYCTTIPGMFSAGNVLHVHDLVDYVSEEAIRAARCMLEQLRKTTEPAPSPVAVSVENDLKYVIPNTYFPGRKTLFSFRPTIVTDCGILSAKMDGKEIWQQKLRFVRPAEMIIVELKESLLAEGKPLVFTLQEAKEE